MNAGKILWRPKFGPYSLILAVFGHFWPIYIIFILFSLFLKTEKSSKQYFLHIYVENISF